MPSFFTCDCGTRSSTLSNWMVYCRGLLPVSVPPGSGNSCMLMPQPATATVAATKAALIPARAECRPARYCRFLSSVAPRCDGGVCLSCGSGLPGTVPGDGFCCCRSLLAMPNGRIGGSVGVSTPFW